MLRGEKYLRWWEDPFGIISSLCVDACKFCKIRTDIFTLLAKEHTSFEPAPLCIFNSKTYNSEDAKEKDYTLTQLVGVPPTGQR